MAKPHSTAKAPAFRFYPKDFLTSERQVAMSAAAAGVYIRLMCHCWLSESLPNDPAVLAKMSGADDAEFAHVWPSIESCFTKNKRGRLVHPRLILERKKQDDYAKSQRTSGLRGASKRWGRHQDPIRVATQTPMAKNSSSSSFPSSFAFPSSIPEERTNTKKEQIHPALQSAPEGFDAFWAIFPRRTAKAAALRAWQKLKPSAALREQIAAALAWQVHREDWTRERGKYNPYPATRLNAGQWTDEPPSAAAQLVSDIGRQNLENGRIALARIAEGA